jgi:hypothetical protein
MADEPNNDMEKILRAYTEARRKGADLPLHPATRKMLQAEVARRYKNAAAQPYWSRWRAFWPRLAFGSGLCAILIIAVLSLRQPSRTNQPAAKPDLNQARPAQDRYLRETVEPSKEREVVTPRGYAGGAAANAPASVVPATPMQASAPEPKVQAASTPEILRRRDTLAVAPPPRQSADKEEEQVVRLKDASVARGLAQRTQTNPQESSLGRARTPVGRPVELKTDGLATKADVATTAEKLATANEMTNLGAALRTRFVDLPKAANVPAANAVLNSFQFEQQGDDLRIVDGDGSVYLGQLSPGQPGQHPAQPNMFGYEPAGAVVAPLGLTENSSNIAVYFVHAQGTNITLAKPVTLDARFLERTNPALSGGATPGLETTVATKRAATAPLSKARKAIVGRVVVGATNQFPVNAISVDPAN